MILRNTLLLFKLCSKIIFLVFIFMIIIFGGVNCSRNSSEKIRKLIINLSDEQERERSINALSSIGEPAVPSLITTLNGNRSDIRIAAATALGKIGSQKAALPLAKALMKSGWEWPSSQVILAPEELQKSPETLTILSALSKVPPDAQAVEFLRNELRSAQDGRLSGPSPWLISSLTRATLAEMSLAAVGDEKFVEELFQGISLNLLLNRQEDLFIQEMALYALTLRPDNAKVIVKFILQKRENKPGEKSSLHGVNKSDSALGIPIAEPVLLNAIARFGKSGIHALAPLTNHPDNSVQLLALAGISEIARKNPDCVPLACDAFMSVMKTEDQHVREMAKIAFDNIGCKK